MEQESYVAAPLEGEWVAPTFEEIRVSAEATAYMGIQDDGE